jgi:hypothetical protein
MDRWMGPTTTTHIVSVLFCFQEMDGPGESDPDLRPADHPRFCEEIKRNLPSYAAHFTRVFQNKTFHVYKLSRNK